MLDIPNEEIRRDYLAGYSARELAQIHGVSPQTIARRLAQMGVEIRPYSMPRLGRKRHYDVPLDQVRALRGQGYSVVEIAADLGFPRGVIRKRMVEAGISRLPPKARPHKNAFYRGGRTWDTGGYVLVLVPSHPRARNGRYVAEHRLVVEAEIGRLLKPGEVVDHRNGDTTDNRWPNLRLFESNAEHLRVTLGGLPKRSRRSSSFDPSGPTPSASETGAEPSLRQHPLFPFPLGIGEPDPSDS
jgi:transposase